MSLLESLSRHRPVIIFKEIDHVIQNRVGIFISDRNYESLKNTISHIDNNYENIQEMIKKNNLPTLDDFINNLMEQNNFKKVASLNKRLLSDKNYKLKSNESVNEIFKRI